MWVIPATVQFSVLIVGSHMGTYPKMRNDR